MIMATQHRHHGRRHYDKPNVTHTSKRRNRFAMPLTPRYATLDLQRREFGPSAEGLSSSVDRLEGTLDFAKSSGLRFRRALLGCTTITLGPAAKQRSANQP